MAKSKVKLVEAADVAVAKAAADYRENPLVRAAGAAAELADQPPLAIICALTIGAGLARRDARLTRAGVRMAAAHALATLAKAMIKRSVDRTRPYVLAEGKAYRRGKGRTNEGPLNSFPSGHTASAVAVARVIAREYPGSAIAGSVVATGVAAVQIPSCHHYVTDIAAGALIGLAVEAIVDAAMPDADYATADFNASTRSVFSQGK